MPSIENLPTIAMNSFNAEPAALKQAMHNAVNRVIESGWYVLGNEGLGFERVWASRCGVDYAIGVGNGMDAIEIILRSLGIGAGDEVVTTPMTAFATVLAILRCGATPVLADIDQETGHISLESTQRCITNSTKAIIYVHLYGRIGPMDIWSKFCNQRNLLLIEDCAQAHLATLNGMVAGSYGAAGAYSFYPTKNLGSLGDGGIIVTNDQSVDELSRQLRNYGQSIRYHHPMVGMNSRLDEIQAAILIERNKWLDEFTECRRNIAFKYAAGFNSPKVELLAPPSERSAHVYHLYVIKCRERDRLSRHLAGRNIQSLIHYPIPIHLQESCKDIKRDPIGLSGSEEYAQACLSVPCHPQMQDEDVSRVIDAINEFT
jgi:dTDP-4-amino-4,6-dideoxygalactose transaminase